MLTCAGLFLQSLWNRQSVWLGLRPDGVTAAHFVLGPRYAPPAARAAFYEQLEARLGRLPGVESVALSDSLPPGGTPRSQPIFAPVVEGKAPFDEATPGVVIWRAVTPDYFRTLGIPIVRGRPFTDDDRRPSERPIILSAAYARKLFGDENPLGHRMSRFPGAERNPSAWYTIVGVAADARNSGLTDRNEPEYYLVRHRGSLAYDDIPMASSVVVRAGPNSAALLRSEIAAMDPALPVVVRSFQRHVGELAARPRFQAWLLALFAGIGMLLAGFGLYGLVSFLVAQREREFGVRLALGRYPGRHPEAGFERRPALDSRRAGVRAGGRGGGRKSARQPVVPCLARQPCGVRDGCRAPDHPGHGGGPSAIAARRKSRSGNRPAAGLTSLPLPVRLCIMDSS